MAGNDAFSKGERKGGAGRLQGEAYLVVAEALDLDFAPELHRLLVVVRAPQDSEGEHHVIGVEGLSVSPPDVPPQLECVAEPVIRDRPAAGQQGADRLVTLDAG